MIGQTNSDYTSRQAAYNLRKLRGKDLVAKPGRSGRYHCPATAASTKREAARSINTQLWEQRGRASLFTLAEAIYDSPDLTVDQQDALIADYEQRAVILRDDAQRRNKLGPAESREIEARPRSARILGL